MSLSIKSLVFIITILCLCCVAGLILVVLGFSQQLSSNSFGLSEVNTVIWELEGTILTQPDPYKISNVQSTDIWTVTKKLDAMATDPDIDFLVIRMKNVQAGISDYFEIRQGILSLQEAGKQVFCYLDNVSLGGYYLASAADEVYADSLTSFFIDGFQLESWFYSDFFNQIGVTADFISVGQYKSGSETYTRNEFSPAAREELTQIVDGMYNRIITSISTGRNLSESQVKEIMDIGIFTSDDAADSSLIDGVCSWQDLNTTCLDLNITEYRSMAGYTPDIGWNFYDPKIALVFLSGEITEGSSYPGSGWFASRIGDDDTVEMLREIKNDQDIKGVILRVDSPGGSAESAERIWQQVNSLVKVKPVVISMGNLAASGGYYISAPCDKILASPFTITGSIGVYGGKFSIGPLLDKLDIHKDAIQRGKNAGVFSYSDSWSTDQRERMLHLMQNTYKLFKSRVATGRQLEIEQVEDVAQGRVWLGKQAIDSGLVDEMGGILEAVRSLKSLLNLSPSSSVQYQVYPRAASFANIVSSFFNPLSIRSQLERSQLERLQIEWERLQTMRKLHVMMILPYCVSF